MRIPVIRGIIDRRILVNYHVKPDVLVRPLDVENVKSSFFDNPELFPVGSVDFDSALLMEGIEHEWHGGNRLCSGSPCG